MSVAGRHDQPQTAINIENSRAQEEIGDGTIVQQINDRIL
jgi:hypothetical protein